MKEKIYAVLGLAMIIAMMMIGGYSDTHYNTIATVYSVDKDGTIFIDGAGYLWSVYDTDYHKDDTVKIYFSTNGTDYTRNDDIIIKVQPLN